jgi:hypothetical protein
VKLVSNAWKIYMLDRVTHLLLFFLREGTWVAINHEYFYDLPILLHS